MPQYHPDALPCPHCGIAPSLSDSLPESPAHHPSQFLSKQSRRAFLGSLGAAAAIGTQMVGFLREPAAAQAETLLAADQIRDAGKQY
jgi:hypothetical protein